MPRWCQKCLSQILVGKVDGKKVVMRKKVTRWWSRWWLAGWLGSVVVLMMVLTMMY